VIYTPKTSKEELERWYLVEKKSPEEIAKMFGVHGKTVRNWMRHHGIDRLGPSHLVTGRKAPWNAKPKPKHVIEALRKANIGREPHNKNSGRIAFSCEVCGTDVFDKPYRKKHTCSKSCRDKMMALRRGELHWNYTDGGTASNQRQRLWAQTQEWRKGVLSRDRVCVSCGSTKRLHAHHLDGWAKHPERRFDPDNGITLCHDCHWRFHREASHKNATREMFEQWIKRSPMSL
jgi:hypothetical protein